jgi:nicotinamidase-related amidase
VDPRKSHVGSLDPPRREELTRALNLVAEAAVAAAVPIHLAFIGTPPDSRERTAAQLPLSAVRVHALSTAGSSWSRSGLDAALAAENRSSLIVGGFWLETTITFLALPALASGFEVFVLMDVSPTSSETAAQPASTRLLQAGAVPVTSRQLVAEWAETSGETDPRSTLTRLFATD